jgi:insulysin
VHVACCHTLARGGSLCPPVGPSAKHTAQHHTTPPARHTLRLASHHLHQFDVNWDALPEALDRFAQFFISPLISADGVEREVKAVDSEVRAWSVWRVCEVCKALRGGGAVVHVCEVVF